MRTLKKLFRRTYPDLDWIQVGVTSRCNAACIYCPHKSLKKIWKGRDLDLDVFKRLSPAFSRTDLVYLQGWGEPLLHPGFFEMLKTVKDQGSLAGLTSNATLLSDENIRRLVDSGLDILSLSVAGVDHENDRVRKGTTLRKVMSSIESVHRIKSSTGSSTPHIHLAYMLLRSGLGKVPEMPGFFNSLGVDQIVVSSLTLALDSDMEKEMYLADSEEGFKKVKDSLVEMKNRVDEPENMFFHVFNPNMPGDECSENIHKACYMSVEGDLRPCVYTDFPDLGPGIFRHFKGQKYPLLNLDFGNIRERPFNKIWSDSDYAQFREDFSRNRFKKQCLYCTKRFIDNLTEPD